MSGRLALDMLARQAAWLDSYGPASQDLYDFWACAYGRWARSVYYRSSALGAALVGPLVLSDAILPATRRLVRRPSVFPIALAHYADALMRLSRLTRDGAGRTAGEGMLALLLEHAGERDGLPTWGYPFDWVGNFGTFPAGTPLITTMPYVYDAFVVAHECTGEPSHLERARQVAQACRDLFPQADEGDGMRSSAYSPDDRRRVINASAYRGWLLVDAGRRFGIEEWVEDGTANLRFVVANQREDGSWAYAAGGSDDFVDNFHTCLVLKGLARALELLPELPGGAQALGRGFAFFRSRLIDAEGLPVPFAVRSRMTLHDRDLYDYAEDINLAVLLEAREQGAAGVADRLVEDLAARWMCEDGHFRTRHGAFGWNEVPYHRWAQSQVMRALTRYAETRQTTAGRSEER